MKEDARAPKTDWPFGPVANIPADHPRRTLRRQGLPVLAILAGVIGGILLAKTAWWNLGISIGAFGLGAGMILFRRRASFGWAIGLCVAAVGVGAIRYEVTQQRVGVDHISRFISSKSGNARIRGIVRSEVETPRRPSGPFAAWMMGGTRGRFLLAATQIELKSGWSSCEGLIRVAAKETLKPLGPGQPVTVYGKLYGWGPAANPGAFDWGAYQRAQGIWAGLTVDHAASIVAEGINESGLSWRGRLRRWAQSMLLEGIPASSEDEVALLKTMVLGRRDAASREMNVAFQRTGTAHFLAVSGLHVGMLGIVVFLLTRALSLSEVWSAAAAGVVILLYVVIADARAPILRAGVMATLLSVAIVARRPIRRSYWLEMSAVVLLLIRPHWLFEIGFQLSFAVTAGVIHLSPRLAAVCSRYLLGRDPEIEALKDRPRVIDEVVGRWHRIRFGAGWLAGKLGAFTMVAWSAWLIGGPMAWFYFGGFAPLGWLFSALLFPLVFLVMSLAVARILVGLILPSLGVVLAGPVANVTGWLMSTAESLAGWPGAGVAWPRPAGWWVLVYLGFWASWAWRVGGVKTQCALAGILIVGGVVNWWPAGGARDDLRVQVLAVGNGSATLIQLPNGGNWVYDAGTLGSYDVGKIAVVPVADRLNIRRFDGVIVSHPNLDHFSGIPTLWSHRRIDRLITNSHFAAQSPPGGPARYFLQLADEAGMSVNEINRGDALGGWDSVRVEVLWPPREAPAELSANDSSIVLRLTYEAQSILLCGDIEAPAQKILLELGNLKADVLILPHHGGLERSTGDFIAAVDPEVVVRSSSKGRHQTKAALFEAIGDRRYFCTADDGAIDISLSGAGIRVRGFLSEPAAAWSSE